MESANSHHHHHQLQDQVLVASSSPSCFQVLPTTTHAAWSSPPPPPTSFLNTNGFISSYPSQINLNSRQQQQQENNNNNTNPLLSSSSQYNSNMAPDFGNFYWPHHNTTDNYINQSPHDQFPSSRTIKEELAETYYRNYMEILHTTTSSSSPSSTTTTTQHHQYSNLISSNDTTDDHDLRGGTKLLLKSLSSANNLINNNNNKNINHQLDHHMYGEGGGRGGFSHIFPSVNVSSINNQTGFTNPGGSLDMNLEALDLLTSSRFCPNFDTSSQNQIGMLRDDGNFTNYGFADHMQQPHQVPFHASTKVSSAPTNGTVVETKRSSSSRIEPKAPNAPKKSRLEARVSCPPFKVRKEKLGDRIAALQQLVAPFGKTDTASVLMEAIGYIKFLQSQVETLSVPYMKASRNKCNRVIKGGPGDNENEESKRDLKGRGLCLVPLSCLSYITDGDGGAAVWPPPHFGGPT